MEFIKYIFTKLEEDENGSVTMFTFTGMIISAILLGITIFKSFSFLSSIVAAIAN